MFKNAIKKHEVKYYIGAIILIIAIFTLPEHDTAAEDKHYCTMVDIQEKSYYAYGWPDYKDIYEETCKGASK